MGTVPTPNPTEDEKVAQRQQAEREWAEAIRRERIDRAKQSLVVLATGGEGQPWRRPVLFVIVAATLAFAGPIGAIGLAAIVALAYTDRVVTTEPE